MENFVDAMKEKLNKIEKNDWFSIGYEMVQYLIDNHKIDGDHYVKFMSDLQEHDDRFLFITLMKNLVSQVNNGGFYQYFDNGYASYNKLNDGDMSAHEDLIELFKKYVPKNEKTSKLLNMLINFENDISTESCESCDGSGYCHDEYECPDCHGEGYIDEEECFRCGGSGNIEEEYSCIDCGGTGESSYVSYHGNCDNEFYDLFEDGKLDELFTGMLIFWIVNWNKDCTMNQFQNIIKNESVSNSKPKLKLSGTDGNAFAIIGKLIDCLRRNGYTYEQLNVVKKECMSGNYDNVIATACKYCEVY